MKKPNTLLKVVSILYIVFNIIGGILVFATMSSDEFKKKKTPLSPLREGLE